MKDSLGDRMKKYESVFSYRLPIKTPVILRIDGKDVCSKCWLKHCDQNDTFSLKKEFRVD